MYKVQCHKSISLNRFVPSHFLYQYCAYYTREGVHGYVCVQSVEYVPTYSVQCPESINLGHVVASP